MIDKTVLVVDDELHLTHILQYKLEHAGLTVITANDGQEAYELACAHLPDLVLTDFQMPGVDGYQMALMLREHEPTADIPILMLTARGHKLTPSQLVRTNIQYLIAKPFSAKQLLEKARELLGLPAEEAEADLGADSSNAAP